MAKSIAGVWMCGRLLGLIGTGLKGGRRFFVAAPMIGRPWERLDVSERQSRPVGRLDLTAEVRIQTDLRLTDVGARRRMEEKRLKARSEAAAAVAHSQSRRTLELDSSKRGLRRIYGREGMTALSGRMFQTRYKGLASVVGSTTGTARSGPNLGRWRSDEDVVSGLSREEAVQVAGVDRTQATVLQG
ncbi:proline-rich receptor-like protein kinase PERK9 [Iris pallida]|uniref:Proline-rich receptor-like protein kinase PERK9 n=1 Tax=Iris pallida TaxID=29817 RepID=A0AAX6G907_IRIPA|nr:proline-rich receptor-like protein kinase PERK9 [Iris pallida]